MSIRIRPDFIRMYFFILDAVMPDIYVRVSWTCIRKFTVLGQVFVATWLPSVQSRYCSYVWVRNIHPEKLVFFLTVQTNANDGRSQMCQSMCAFS